MRPYLKTQKQNKSLIQIRHGGAQLSPQHFRGGGYLISKWNSKRQGSGWADETLLTVCMSSASRKQNKRTLWKTVWYLPTSRTMTANPRTCMQDYHNKGRLGSMETYTTVARRRKSKSLCQGRGMCSVHGVDSEWLWSQGLDRQQRR